MEFHFPFQNADLCLPPTKKGHGWCKYHHGEEKATQTKGTHTVNTKELSFGESKSKSKTGGTMYEGG